MIGSRQQGGERSAARIALIAGEIDHRGCGRHIGRDLDLQQGADTAGRDLGGSFERDAQNAQAIGG